MKSVKYAAKPHYEPAALHQPVRKFSYRFLLSLSLCLLILLSLTLNYAGVSIFILLFINVAFCADIIFRSAWKDFSAARCSFSVFLSISVAAGFLYCTFNTFLIRPLAGPQVNLFAYVPILLTLGLWVQQRMTRTYERVDVFIKKLDDFLPKSGRLQQCGKTRMVFVNELKPGDCVWVQPGERIPCDGIIRQGKTAIDEQLISGNLLPTSKGKDSRVFAGTLNKTAPILVEVSASLEMSALLGILSAIKNSEVRHRCPVNSLEKSAPWLSALLVIAAGGSYGYVLMSHAGNDWFYYTGVFWLILALGCPVAWLFAAILPPFFGTLGAKRLGIFLNHPDALSVFVRANTLFLDKTGTLTKGELQVEKVCPVARKNSQDLLIALASAEQQVDSAYAQAVHRYMDGQNIEVKPLLAQEVIPGKGVRAKTSQGILLAGRKEWLQEQGVRVPSVDTEKQAVIWVAAYGKYLGYITLVDQLREGAAETVHFLQKQGKEIILISGDSEPSVQAVARQTGIEKINSQVLPKTKAEVISNMCALGKKVVMVGDGFNDIVALLKADSGIVFSSGKNVYNHWVDIVTVRPDLFVLKDLFTIDKRLRRNLYCSMALSVLLQGGFIAALFWKPELFASWQAVLGVALGSVLLILIDSMRLLKIK